MVEGKRLRDQNFFSFASPSSLISPFYSAATSAFVAKSRTQSLIGWRLLTVAVKCAGVRVEQAAVSCMLPRPLVPTLARYYVIPALVRHALPLYPNRVGAEKRRRASNAGVVFFFYFFFLSRFFSSYSFFLSLFLFLILSLFV